jgi:hypothetical protein
MFAAFLQTEAEQTWSRRVVEAAQERSLAAKAPFSWMGE